MTKDLEKIKIDRDILEQALKVMTLALDELIADCADDKGGVKAPTKQAIAKLRGYLPEYCKMAYPKKQR